MQPLECCRLPHRERIELDITALNQPLFFPCSCERIQVTLNLDGIVQVLDYHLSDTSIGMMTRIAVLKWLYHLYIKTPRKVSWGLSIQLSLSAPSLFHCLDSSANCNCLGSFANVCPPAFSEKALAARYPTA